MPATPGARDGANSARSGLWPGCLTNCVAQAVQQRGCAPSPLAGEGWDGGGSPAVAPPALTPTLTLPRRGGGNQKVSVNLYEEKDHVEETDLCARHSLRAHAPAWSWPGSQGRP